MKYYDLIKCEINKKIICIIFSTTYISPLKSLNEIENNYKSFFVDCTDIYYDFLLCKKNANERFAKVINYEDKLDISKIEYINIKKRDLIREISAKYYKEHFNDLDWTYVSSIKQKLIAKGIVI